MSGIQEIGKPAAIFTTLTVGSALKYVCSIWMRKQYCENLHCVGKISSLFYYPVKSLRGIELKEAEATKLGLHYDGVTDRHWLVTRNGEFLSQRQEARLSLVSVEIRGEELRLDAVGMGTLILPAHPIAEKSKVDRIMVRKQTIDALDCGDEASKWISTFMNIERLKIYCTPPSLEKRTSAMDRGREHGARQDDKVAFHDYSSYMVMSDASLEKLNGMIPRPVPKINFRPNFTVKGCEAFDEDTWKELRVGNAVFRKIDSCTRCVMTTIDISTGKKSEDGEPLKTLKKHWLVATKGGNVVSMTQEATMSLVCTSIHDDNLHLDAPGMDTLILPVNPNTETHKGGRVTVKGQTVDALDCGDKAAAWIQKFLNKDGLRMFHSGTSFEKRQSQSVKKDWKHDAKPEDKVAFASYGPYMVLSEASLTTLNGKVDKAVPALNFRPNIMVEGCGAFEEDNWKEIRIGKAVFRPMDACTRCVMVTIDLSNGMKSQDEEPLKTLKGFRQKQPYGPKPIFGRYFAADAEGDIKINDIVYAVSS